MSHQRFIDRHLGPRAAEIQGMLKTLGYDKLDDLIEDVIPSAIRMEGELALPAARSEREALEDLAAMAAANPLNRS